MSKVALFIFFHAFTSMQTPYHARDEVDDDENDARRFEIISFPVIQLKYS